MVGRLSLRSRRSVPRPQPQPGPLRGSAEEGRPWGVRGDGASDGAVTRLPPGYSLESGGPGRLVLRRADGSVRAPGALHRPRDLPRDPTGRRGPRPTGLTNIGASRFALRGRHMRDPGCGVLRTSLPRTQVDRGASPFLTRAGPRSGGEVRLAGTGNASAPGGVPPGADAGASQPRRRHLVGGDARRLGLQELYALHVHDPVVCSII